MKSIKNLEGVQILSKKKMRNVEGAGTCAYTDGDGIVRTGISKATAVSLMAMSGAGAHWCCASCGSATWL
jgi:hypothetical protein